jgi:hypothetical protein
MAGRPARVNGRVVAPPPASDREPLDPSAITLANARSE